MTKTKSGKMNSTSSKKLPLLYSVEQATKKLKIGRSFLFKLLHDGKLAKTKIGRRTFISSQEIKRFLRACECDALKEISDFLANDEKTVRPKKVKIKQVATKLQNKRRFPTLPPRSKIALKKVKYVQL